ncbi:MAG: chemotaxis protein CheC [Symbiobacteriaceae bacterium]|nr:chemotaxis protein CheC [Symbiobacteriaceae bacterium]
MSIGSYEQINDVHLDVLREIGNIGAGNATTALSMMLGKRIEMAPPIVRLTSIPEITNALGGPENMVVGILCNLTGDIEGMMMFVLEQAFAHQIISQLLMREISNYDEMDDMDFSALREIGNIMAGSFSTAISALTNLNIGLDVPGISIDMAGAIMSVPAVAFGTIGDYALYIEEDIMEGEQYLKSRLLLIPTLESLNKIMRSLGLEV